MIAAQTFSFSKRMSVAPRWLRVFDPLMPWILLAGLSLFSWVKPSQGQGALTQDTVAQDSVIPLKLAIGRSMPMTTPVPIQRVALANPEVADVLLVSERELVLNALASGVTDLILWQTDGRKFHYRVSVHALTEMQVLLRVRIAEVSRDFLRELGASFLWADQHSRAGTGAFVTTPPVDEPESISLRQAGQFATLLSLNEIKNLSGLLEMAEQTGRLKVLAEPNLMAANRERASFLAGGELPVPIAQPVGVSGVQAVTIQYREFGIRLDFVPEILSENLIQLKIEAEVSGLDFANGITTSGFLVPAFRTRRASTTVALQEGQTLAIAGLLSSEEQKINTGMPLLKDIPILGLLFSSQRFQRKETELLVLVSPQIIDPTAPPPPPPLPGEKGSRGDGERGGSQ